jgi:hypothetical protein
MASFSVMTLIFMGLVALFSFQPFLFSPVWVLVILHERKLIFLLEQLKYPNEQLFLVQVFSPFWY